MNRFQTWAFYYAGAHGFLVTRKGNWVELEKGGEVIECMSQAGVEHICQCDWLGKPLRHA